MKRITTLLFGLLLLLGPAMLATSPAVHAQSNAQKAAACFSTWNGKTFSDTSKKASKFSSDPCSDHTTGNCFTKSLNTQGTSLQVVCDKTYGSNKQHYANQTTNNTVPDTPVNTDSGPGDPAINFAESNCSESACNIIPKIINPIIELLTVVVGLAVVIGIVYGGIQVTTSAGDPQKAASGKDHIRNALIAIVAYLLLFGFISWLVPGGIV